MLCKSKDDSRRQQWKKEVYLRSIEKEIIREKGFVEGGYTTELATHVYL